MSLALWAYAAVSSAVFPFIEGWLDRRHAEGADERRGIYAAEKLQKLKRGKTLWIHAVSVGEVQAASSVVDRIAASGWDGATLLSTVTETGALSADMLMGGKIASRVFAPWDIPVITRRAADAIAPAVYATVETEVWPNLLSEMRRRGIPTMLINARISDRTLARAKPALRLMKEAYGMFDAILARSQDDERRLVSLGVEGSVITVTGDTKVDALARRKANAGQNIRELRQKILPRGGPCFVAGSTHPGEDEVLIEAFSRLLREKDPPGAKLVIVPRHPDRAEAVFEIASAVGGAELYTKLRGPDESDILIVDAVGLLFDLYGLADAAFVGGSLVPKGGQNILEPAIWGVPVLHGPHMEDFAGPANELDSSGMSFKVETADEIERLWRLAAKGALLRPPENQSDYIKGNTGAADRVLTALKRYLP
ncbi:MAG: 3-deoxy-D-manno-octulosonic acid transferase [Synergistaceae bacterium]|jgi:3-deoxy-D-manno-octulosonic-acid transferase|nr:3-deoxy-D-manno-octulosonic acid transferase [Synergistaceae bacterium]